MPELSISVTFLAADPRADRIREPRMLPRLIRLAEVAADEFQMLGQIATGRRLATAALPEAAVGVAEDAVPWTGDPPGIVSEFLLGTLIAQPRLLRRGNVSYHSLARWRSGIKDSQVKALRALKVDPPRRFVEEVARRLLTAANDIHGLGNIVSVVNVPCGNSGPRCLAAQLRECLASMGSFLPIDAFQPIPTAGASHPKRNVRRPPMRLATVPPGPVLLVDDVATSGRHIEEATLLLRDAGASVLPLTWIG